MLFKYLCSIISKKMKRLYVYFPVNLLGRWVWTMCRRRCRFPSNSVANHGGSGFWPPNKRATSTCYFHARDHCLDETSMVRAAGTPRRIFFLFTASVYTPKKLRLRIKSPTWHHHIPLYTAVHIKLSQLGFSHEKCRSYFF